MSCDLWHWRAPSTQPWRGRGAFEYIWHLPWKLRTKKVGGRPTLQLEVNQCSDKLADFYILHPRN